MESSNQALKFSIAAFLLLLILAPTSDAAITSCNGVVKGIRPCLRYLQRGNGKPPKACCAGAKTLAAAVKTTRDKQAVCTCIKSAVSGMKFKPKIANALPRNCGINIPFPASSNVDCTKIR